MNLKGIVLAGGRSRRFGSDKALARIGSMTMIEKSLALIKKLGLEPVIVTHESADYSFLKCAVLRDMIPNQGPLGGLYTAMTAYNNNSLLVLTCDMPSLPAPAIEKLLRSHQKEDLATVYQLQGGPVQPFPGIYDSRLADSILEQLKTENLSMQKLLERLQRVHTIPSKWPPEIFRNINFCKELY